MKNKLLLGVLLFSIAGLFTACSDDNDSNPTLTQPTEFKLNTPAYINEAISLETTDALPLSWSQPKFTVEDAPINATYEIQVSLDNSFTVSTDEAANDEEGQLVADYAAIDRTTQKCTYNLSAEDLDKALVKLGKYTEDDVPAIEQLYIRVLAFVQEGTKRLYSTASNAVQLAAVPYYIELKDALPIIWYIVGDNFLGWGKVPGTDCFPLFVQSGYQYDKKTGTGELTYLNYFTWDGWKIQPPTFDWNYGIMSGGSANSAVYRDGGNDGGNIWCSPQGFYKVTLNTGTFECKIEKVEYETAPTNYEQICLAGSFNNWGDTNMTAVNKTGENHVWCYVMTVEPGVVEEIKFKIANSWDSNWGFGSYNGEVNTCGVGKPGGSNIGVPEGTWVIMFNDITHEFSITAMPE